MSIQDGFESDNSLLDALRANSERPKNETSNSSAAGGKAALASSEAVTVGIKSVAAGVGVAETGGVARNDERFSALGKYIGDLRPFLSVGAVSESASDADLKALVSRLSAYDRRAFWQKYTTLRAVMCCGYPAKMAKVRVTNKKGVRHYRGVERCKSSWVCIVCARVIRHGRSEEIKRASVYGMEKLALNAFMVTRTIQHSSGESLRSLIKLQAACKRWVDSQRDVKAFYGKYGFIGAITAKEVTHSFRSGWHPHTHELMFFRKELNTDVQTELHKLLFTHTNNFYVRHGHKGITASKGINVQEVHRGIDDVASYLQKLDGGFNANNELTRIDLKRGRNGSRTAFQIQEDFCNNPNKADYGLLIEYEDATMGMHVLHWKQGLRVILLPDEKELTDDELIEIEIGGLDELEFENWYFKQIKSKKLDGLILAALQVGGIPAMIALLDKHKLHDATGYEILDTEAQEIKTAFDLKLEKKIKEYGEHILSVKDREIAENAAYATYLRKGHWRTTLDAIDKQNLIFKAARDLKQREETEALELQKKENMLYQLTLPDFPNML